jgi:hypothetical protein
MIGRFTAPAMFDGTIQLVHEPIDQVSEQRTAWIYNDGAAPCASRAGSRLRPHRRWHRGLAHDRPVSGLQRRHRPLQLETGGKKEMYVPYNTYRIGDKKLKYKDIVDANTVRSDLMRYELHRVWVVEATLKDGMRTSTASAPSISTRTAGWCSARMSYDTRGNLWRVGVHGLRQNYDALVPWYGVQIWHDLTNGNYLVDNLDNEIKTPIVFGKKAKWADFQPERLNRTGVASAAENPDYRLEGFAQRPDTLTPPFMNFTWGYCGTRKAPGARIGGTSS